MKKPLHHRGVPPKGSTGPMHLGRSGALLLLALVLAPACTEAPPV
jgi:hypothetical protein